MRSGTTLGLLLLLVLAGCSGGQVMEIRADGRTVTARAEVRHERIYVAVDPLAEALGLTAGYNGSKPEQGVLLQKEGQFVHLHLDAEDCHVDGRTVDLGAPALYLDRKTGSPMVPVGFVAEVFGARAALRPATHRSRAAIVITPAP